MKVQDMQNSVLVQLKDHVERKAHEAHSEVSAIQDSEPTGDSADEENAVPTQRLGKILQIMNQSQSKKRERHSFDKRRRIVAAYETVDKLMDSQAVWYNLDVKR